MESLADYLENAGDIAFEQNRLTESRYFYAKAEAQRVQDAWNRPRWSSDEEES